MTDLYRRELHIHGGPWRDVLAVDRATLAELFARADHERLANLHKTTMPEASIDILVSDASVSLWLGDVRLAIQPIEAPDDRRPEAKER